MALKNFDPFAGLETCDTAGLEACATGFARISQK